MKQANTARARTLHGSAKSGYVRDINPEAARTGLMGAVLPVATTDGEQEGVIPPAKRKYGVAKYEKLSAEEALARMTARQSGKLPPIRGGLDDNTGRTLEEVEKIADRMTPDELADDTGYSISPDGEMEDGFSPKPMAEKVPQRAPQSASVNHGKPSKIDAWLGRRKRVTLELQNGDMTISVIDAIPSRFGITLILPRSPDGATFVPKPGSDVTISIDQSTAPYYFPGTVCELDEIGITILAFLRKDE